MTAGTSDLPVAEEARVTAETWNCEVALVADVGVAGIHRLFRRLPDLEGADALVVVAGMEGALPSVVGGLVDCPVIAVPTSIGYGASFGGLAALLGMLNSCSSNVVVVNIDAGFNGGHVAGLIASRAGQARSASGGGDGQERVRTEDRRVFRLMAIERIEALPRLPPGPSEANKGMYGTVLALAGGRGMAGAAALVGAAALRSGAGLVRVLCPERGPADRRQLRALLHDLAGRRRPRGPGGVRAVEEGPRKASWRRPTSWRWAPAWASPPASGPWSLGARGGHDPDGPRRRRPEQPGRPDRGPRAPIGRPT